MYPQMTLEQKELVEAHLELVPKMVYAMTRSYPITLDQRQELCQVGYLALCRAALFCKDGYAFTPYAASAIRNAIYDSWRHEIRDKDHLCPLSFAGEKYRDDSSLDPSEAEAYLARLKTSQCSTIRKGIDSLCLQLEGYSIQDLCEHYQAPANHIRAWQSKARKLLRQDRTLYALLA